MAIKLVRHSLDARGCDVADQSVAEIVPDRLEEAAGLAVGQEQRAGLLKSQDGGRTMEMTVPVSLFDRGNLARRGVAVRGVARAPKLFPSASRPNCSAVMPDGAPAIEAKRHFSFSLTCARMRSMSVGSNSFLRPIGM